MTTANNVTNYDKIKDFRLPKWPQMRVAGPRVLPSQASEIIRRTDQFFDWPSGNDRGWILDVQDILGMPVEPENPYDYEDPNSVRQAAYNDLCHRYYEEKRIWLERWGHITTSYVHNTWISSCYIGGPYGWCSPEGVIYYGVNVGKHPSVEELVKDWSTLAEAFPFVKAEVLFMDQEWSEDERPPQPVFGLLVDSGSVDCRLPHEHEFHTRQGFEWHNTNPSIETMVRRLGSRHGNPEAGIPVVMLENWARQMQMSYSG